MTSRSPAPRSVVDIVDLHDRRPTAPLIVSLATASGFRTVPSTDIDVTTEADARLGTVLKAKYRLDSVLGVGGMAIVYAATHRNQKRLAVKILRAELSVRADVRTRFLREGYIANTVGHPGAVAVLDDDVAGSADPEPVELACQ